MECEIEEGVAHGRADDYNNDYAEGGGDLKLKFMTVTNAKAILTALVTEVEATGEPVAITKNGIPVVILRKVRQEEFLLMEEPPITKSTKGGKPGGSRKRDL